MKSSADSYSGADVIAQIVAMKKSAEEGELYGFADECKRLLAMLANPSSGPHGEAVAWRWRVKNTVDPLPWIHAAKKPDNLSTGIEWELEPLYLISPATRRSE